MLETVKSTINNLPSISFEEYYTQYVMQMQDMNIDNEVSFLLRNNCLTSLDIDKLSFKELRSLHND